MRCRRFQFEPSSIILFANIIIQICLHVGLSSSGIVWPYFTMHWYVNSTHLKVTINYNAIKKNQYVSKAMNLLRRCGQWLLQSIHHRKRYFHRKDSFIWHFRGFRWNFLNELKVEVSVHFVAPFLRHFTCFKLLTSFVNERICSRSLNKFEKIEKAWNSHSNSSYSVSELTFPLHHRSCFPFLQTTFLNWAPSSNSNEEIIARILRILYKI